MPSLKRLVLPIFLLAATALGGCVYAPYPGYYPYYTAAYAAPVVTGVYVGGGGGYYRHGYWR